MTAKQRISRNAPAIDLTAVKYIRIIIASYIMAVGLGVVSGFDVNAYFSAFLSHPLSLYVSNVFVTFCAMMLFFGFFVRFVALCLAIVILASSIQVNLVVPVQGSIDAFWADLVLVCGLLACYCRLSQRQLRKLAFVKFDPSAQRLRSMSKRTRVVPRRVTAARNARDRRGNAIKTASSGASVVPPSVLDATLKDRLSHLAVHLDCREGEIKNIFV